MKNIMNKILELLNIFEYSFWILLVQMSIPIDAHKVVVLIVAIP